MEAKKEYLIMSFKIILVTPPYHTGIIEVIGKWPPLSLVYLAGHLRNEGFSIEIYDAMSLDHTIIEVENTFKQKNPDMVMIGSYTSSNKAALDTLRVAKHVNPKVITCLGGVHPTFCYEDILLSETGTFCPSTAGLALFTST